MRASEFQSLEVYLGLEGGAPGFGESPATRGVARSRNARLCVAETGR